MSRKDLNILLLIYIYSIKYIKMLKKENKTGKIKNKEKNYLD